MTIKSRWQERRRRLAAQATLEEQTARAARLGITPERVLEEYRRIAFANLSHIVHWSDAGMQFKPDGELDPDDVAAIAEIVESAKEGKPYRVKLYDKKAALDAIARYLGMVPPPLATPNEDEPPRDDGEDHRAALILELDRLAAQRAKGPPDRKPQC
ncbi:MAG TPA: terminase small subunit [Stellaceae bacterium]|nr:terminase small subunit [Stellaceae bacterium]